MPEPTNTRTGGRDDLTGWYRLNPKPTIANAQAEALIEKWGIPCRWPSISGILRATAESDRRAA